MEASQYAFVQGIGSTRRALRRWNAAPWRVLRGWLCGSVGAAALLLGAVWAVAVLAPAHGAVALRRPPLGVGHLHDVAAILSRNGLVLALHAMACVAGFIAGSSLPLQAAQQKHATVRRIHEQGGRIAIAFVAGATAFSLSTQALVLGRVTAQVSGALHTDPAALLVALAPHALPELVALFLPLAAWILASRRGAWHDLLAATVVTVALAVPVLTVAAVWEVYVAPRLLHALFAYRF